MKNGRTTEVSATAGRDAGIVARTPDLFDDAPVPLGAWPRPATLEGRFLSRMLRGAESTAGDWLRDARSMRLAAEVHELRAAGWDVRTKLETVTTRDRGRRATVARYSLPEVQRMAALASETAAHFLAAVDAAEGRQC
jgi:hypothetical protein